MRALAIVFSLQPPRSRARPRRRRASEVNSRLATISARDTDDHCDVHHMSSWWKPTAPLATIVTETATAAGADSAIRMYRALRDRYYGRDAY